MIITRAVSLTNFLVASSALGFQVFVLYPWHKELDKGFEELKKEHLRVLDAIVTSNKAGAAITKEQEKGMRDRLADLSHHNRSATSTNPTRPVYSTLPGAAASTTSSNSASSTIASTTIATSTSPSSLLSESFKAASLLYAKYAIAGAFCCSFTHAVLTPVDVVKTRIQLDPASYTSGIAGSARQIAAREGPAALLTGAAPTIVGYALQGAFKFGGYEFFKARLVDALGLETAAAHRVPVYLAASAAAEVLGDIALCPFEAVRIRLVSDPAYARGLLPALAKMARNEGLRGLYSGFGPVLMKQVPYTMATFVVYEKATQLAYSLVDKSTLSSAAVTGVNLSSGLVAGVAAAIVSHPADTVLSKINKEGGRPGQGILRRVFEIASGLGIRGSFTGLHARIVMVGGMTALQFAIYGDIKKAFGATDGVELKVPEKKVKTDLRDVVSIVSPSPSLLLRT